MRESKRPQRFRSRNHEGERTSFYQAWMAGCVCCEVVRARLLSKPKARRSETSAGEKCMFFFSFLREERGGAGCVGRKIKKRKKGRAELAKNARPPVFRGCKHSARESARIPRSTKADAAEVGKHRPTPCPPPENGRRSLAARRKTTRPLAAQRMRVPSSYIHRLRHTLASEIKPRYAKSRLETSVHHFPFPRFIFVHNFRVRILIRSFQNQPRID